MIRPARTRLARRASAALGAAASAALLAGCSSLGVGPDRDARGPAAPSFAGRMMTVVAASGQASTLRFERDGTVRAIFGAQETAGRWRLDDGDLCFTWARDYRECWKDVGTFERRRTRTLTSDRGNVVRVTLQ